ncbi:hypothetical protein EJ08DRAFT_725254 [Tothia fuscella]|uniref:Uncharacterized protein n=1 Tax=Tothia fuscella TaxID=1048955 RepID=A0A9P4NIE9_9PEZI|nr:hypothetical protein EJ08DRAFT_725254 [Tothia fuscella]
MAKVSQATVIALGATFGVIAVVIIIISLAWAIGRRRQRAREALIDQNYNLANLPYRRSQYHQPREQRHASTAIMSSVARLIRCIQYISLCVDSPPGSGHNSITRSQKVKLTTISEGALPRNERSEDIITPHPWSWHFYSNGDSNASRCCPYKAITTTIAAETRTPKVRGVPACYCTSLVTFAKVIFPDRKGVYSRTSY